MRITYLLLLADLNIDNLSMILKIFNTGEIK
jgi:hypothetical protein